MFLTDSCVETMEKPSLEDALDFIFEVKRALISHPNQENNKYHHFCFALDEFYRQKISAEFLVSTLENLFESHENLLSGFKNFLPEDQETKRVTNSCRNKGNSVPEFQRQACNEFIFKVRDRFRNNPEVDASFLDILVLYGKGDKSMIEAYEMIYNLFFGHADLIGDFDSFFSDRDEKVRKEIEKIQGFVDEDWLHEADRWKSLLSSAKKVAKRVIAGECLDDDTKFTPMNLRCIENLYGEYGPEVMQELNNNPGRVLPIILPRLNQKKLELKRVKSCMIKFLRECRHRRRGIE